MTLTFFELKVRAASFAAVALILGACEGKPGDTDSGTETGQGSTTTDTTGDGPTTGPADTTDSGGTMSGTSTTSPTTGQPDTTTTGETMGGQTTGDGTTAGTTEGTSEGTTGGIPDGELGEACMAACEKFFECIDNPPFPDVEACMIECGAAPDGQPTCVEAYTALNNCVAGLDCPQFEDAFVNEEFGPCTDEFEALGEACQVCEGFGGGGPDGCSIGQQCPNQPLQEYLCEGDTCTCLVDNQPQGMCPANGFCALDFDAQAQAANDCCGFEF